MSTHKEFIGSFTRKLRDMECDLRKSADRFDKLGAVETARVHADKANLIDRIIDAMIRNGEAWQPGGEQSELKPCECECGWKVVKLIQSDMRSPGYYCECESCYKVGTECKSKADAIADWNERNQ